MAIGSIKAWGWRLTVAVLALVSGGHAAVAQSDAVPASWRSYAGLVGQQFQAWLMADDDTAYRLHKFLEDRAVGATDTPPGPILIKVWVDAAGQVTRLDFPSLGKEKADADLRQLLTASPLSEPPPPEMLQPLTLRLNLRVKS